MAGESAREVARRAREKAERLNTRADMFEQGADGEAATAEVLATLPPGWTSLHDVRWPGRRLANVDHVLIGPGGVFVIDSKNWTGQITLRDGSLRQNGYSREKAVAGAADAALAVAELISPYASWVHPVMCFVGQEHLSGWSRDVMVCSTTNLVTMLTTRPVVFTPEIVHYLHSELGKALSRPVVPPVAARSSRPRAPRRASAPPRRRRGTKSPELSILRFVFGVAMLVVLISAGPQLAAGIGGLVGQQLTKNFVTPSCSAQAEAGAVTEPGGAQKQRKQSAKPKRGNGSTNETQDSQAQPAASEPCAAP